MTATGPRAKRLGMRAARATMPSTALVIAGFCAGWVLSSTSNRGTIDLPVPLHSPPLPYGLLSDALFVQGLSHIAFHTEEAKRSLAGLVAPRHGPPGAVGVVGVEWGSEVSMFAELGYRVHAFEPVQQFHASIQRMLTANKRRAEDGVERRWDVHLHKIAVGELRSGNVTVAYNTDHSRITETVRRGRVDDFIRDELVVLSLDIQGDELDVLKGATQLLSRKVGVRSLWIEIFPCNTKVLEIFRLLDPDYVLFDFVPWGLPVVNKKLATKTVSLTDHPRYLPEEGITRPSRFEQYFSWMCEQRRSHFKWMQSDVLAVRRDLVTKEFLTKLGMLANDLFVQAVKRRM